MGKGTAILGKGALRRLRAKLEQPFVQAAAPTEMFTAARLQALHVVARVGVYRRCLAERTARELF